jgi:hypothetical protein
MIATNRKKKTIGTNKEKNSRLSTCAYDQRVHNRIRKNAVRVFYISGMKLISSTVDLRFKSGSVSMGEQVLS